MRSRTLQLAECPVEFSRIVEDVEANEEMCCRDVVGLEEVIKFVRGLRNQMYE